MNRYVLSLILTVLVLSLFLTACGTSDPAETAIAETIVAETTAAEAIASETSEAVSDGRCPDCLDARRMECPDCKGRGFQVVTTTTEPGASGAYQKNCDRCSASGEIFCPRCTHGEPCVVCNGAGQIECRSCGGHGFTEHHTSAHNNHHKNQRTACYRCRGLGIARCDYCNGSGVR